MKEMYGALGMHTCSENHNEWGMLIMGLGATLPNHIPACRSEFLFEQGIFQIRCAVNQI